MICGYWQQVQAWLHFLSMLQDFETWSNYQKINLVYSVFRTAAELAYVDRIKEIAETFGKDI